MRKKGGRRLLAGFLCMALLAGFLPAGSMAARAEDSWVQPYLDKLVDWGVMRGDQEGNLDPSRSITRAEYVSMINRAYGFVDGGGTPFDDVPISAWYAEDIAIGYRAGYFTGSSDNTAEPEALLTREQATVILGRNLVLESGTGESLDFSDSRELSDWSRGLVKTAAGYGMIKGYPDGSFKPKNEITRGEVASLLVSAIGTPINKPGDYSLGNVYGNVTLSSSDVTLKDTVIAGDLYLTGGVGLGNVTLENVTVLGKIIASGAGESNKGESSIILRNVTAPLMVVDAPGNQFVTLRAEGDTKIDSTSVRTPSYLEDTTGEDMGLQYIELNGEGGTTLQVAGNIKEVMMKTPTGRLVMARGSANIVTVDEKAVGGSVTVDRGGQIKDLRLDVATSVTGQGDIGKLTASAGGSSSTILPDEIVVRPGVDVDISGEEMDTVTASESSESPRIMAGYPRAVDIAPTSADLLVSGNKKGIIYWAVSAVNDGSVGEDDLIAPPTYASIILKSGSVKADISGQEYTAKISGLTAAGGFYVSTVLVDARGQRSPVKVTSFGTPDDSVPNFAANYPIMTKIDKSESQMTVMATKDCRVHYALMPQGAAAPTAADFKAGALTGNLGAGSFDVLKNTTYPQKVNDRVLDEVKTYDLYIWLNDIDGSKSSAVKKLSFTTKDMTPPEMGDPLMTKQETTSVSLTSTMNEAGTISWVALKAGAEYPKPMSAGGAVPALDSLEAKVQVSNGAGGVLKSGKVAMTENKEGLITVPGLTAETVYDFYCIAQDKAGNYSAKVIKMQINTLDPNAPTATIEFTKFNGTDMKNPTANTDIRIVFNEIVQTHPEGKQLTDYYADVLEAGAEEGALTSAKNALGAVLGGVFTMYDLTEGEEKNAPIAPADNWVVDYREAKVTLEDGKTVVTLENGTALDLRSGSTYRIDVQKIADVSRNAVGTLYLPDKKGFTTVFAQVNLRADSKTAISVDGNPELRADANFLLTPIGTKKVDDSINWDMILWSDTSMEFQLYQKPLGGDASTQWAPVGNGAKIVIPSGGGTIGISLTGTIPGEMSFQKLNALDDTAVYEYAMHITSLDGNTDYATWSKEVVFKIGIVAGTNNSLRRMAIGDVDQGKWNNMVTVERSLTSIGNSVLQGSDELTIKMPFTDTNAPAFSKGYPVFTPGDSSVDIKVQLSRPGTVYYVVAPWGDVGTYDEGGQELIGEAGWLLLHEGYNVAPKELSAPTYLDVVGNKLTSGNRDVKWGIIDGGAAATTVTITELMPETKYAVYVVIKGSGQVFTPVYGYRFLTKEVTQPILELTLNNPSVVIEVDRTSDVNYLLLAENGVPSWLKDSFASKISPDDLAALTASGSDWVNPGFTLLDAMLTDIPDDKGKSTGTVFDRYVLLEHKNKIAGNIQSLKASDNVVLVDKANILPGVSNALDVDCSAGGKLTSGTNYTFLAVAKSPLGSGFAFRAARPVMLQDFDAPMVIACNPSGLREVAPSVHGYEGSLTLVFSKPLYYRTGGGSGSTQERKGIEATTGPMASTSDLIALGTIVNMANSVSISAGNLKEIPLTMVTFDFTRLTPGSVVTILGDVVSASGVGHNIPLVISMVLDENGKNPTFTVTPSGWDGRK